MNNKVLFETEYRPVTGQVVSEVYAEGVDKTRQEYPDLIEILRQLFPKGEAGSKEEVITLTIRRVNIEDEIKRADREGETE